MKIKVYANVWCPIFTVIEAACQKFRTPFTGRETENQHTFILQSFAHLCFLSKHIAVVYAIIGTSNLF